MAILPPYLKAGDSIALIATARKISHLELLPSIQLIESWGLKVITAPNLYKEENQFAGSDEERAADLQWALDNETIKAVLCVRGGYGTVRIIDQIDFSKFTKQPKWIIGYSDVTVLHQHIHTNINVATLHATMPINFFKNEEATESLRKTLFGEALHYKVNPYYLNREGETEGELIGGNLSLIYALCGSKSDINTEGKILFIEDLDEYLYHIDRMMLNLKRSGKLAKLKGLVVGGMTDMKDNTIPFGKTAEEIIFDAVKEYNYPVCFDFPAGHIDRNLTLVFGKTYSLRVTKNHIHLKFT
jgi:muramoyltetrapeptide carboxypeptidase